MFKNHFWRWLNGKFVGKIKIIQDKVIIRDGLLVENLWYNLIIISQVCDNWISIEFHKNTWTVKSANWDIC